MRCRVLPSTVRGALLVVPLLLTACGPKTMDARLRDAERTADKASTALDDAARHAEALEPGAMERSLDEAKRLLLTKDLELHPEAQMHLDRYKELAAKLPVVKASREKRDLDQRLEAARDAIVPRSRAAADALEQLPAANPSTAQCDDAEAKVNEARKAIDGSQELFTKDADFASWAKSQRSKNEKGLDAIARCRRGAAFLEGPVAAWTKGLAAHAEAKKVKDVAARVPGLSDARTELSRCAKDAKSFEADQATAATAFVMPRGKAQTPAQLRTTCEKALKKADADLQKAGAAAKKAAKKKK
ncbi:MAG: hypothetical protein JNJ54_12500 [Myxococcaceae bacterium]|nr:hypothetical protein [Myxococcaceae bacterium]